MTKIGILSDTHGYLDQQIYDYFKEVDMIWHAGDIGSTCVTDALKSFKPLYAVYGNIDDQNSRKEFTENQILTVENCKILITHIAGAVGKYNTRVKNLIQEHRPDILVCGHSHIVKIMKDINFNLLHINPGAAGIHGFHKMRTMLRFEINDGKPQNMQLIELGWRGNGEISSK